MSEWDPEDCMVTKMKMVLQDQKLDREPSPEKIPEGRFGAFVDGGNLPSSLTEDVKGFSLCPSYSPKQLRRIQRIAKTKAKQKVLQSEVEFI